MVARWNVDESLPEDPNAWLMAIVSELLHRDFRDDEPRQAELLELLQEIIQPPGQQDVLELLKQALERPDDEDLLRQVGRFADDIRQSLEEGEFELSETALERLEDHNEWTAKVYLALAGADEAPDEEDELTQAIAQMRADEEREIACAFVTALETLPARFHQWERWFAEVSPAPEDYQSYLRKQPIVTAGQVYADGLITFGMSPGTFAEATRGVELLLKRLIRDAFGPEERRPHSRPELTELYQWLRERAKLGEQPSFIVSSYAQSFSKPDCIPHGLLVSQLRGTPACPPAAAEPMVRWLVEVAQLKPFLFAGFRAGVMGEGCIQLTQAPSETGSDILWRWGRPAVS